MNKITCFLLVAIFSFCGASAQSSKNAKIEGRPSAEMEIKDANRLEKIQQQKQLSERPELLEIPSTDVARKKQSTPAANKIKKYGGRRQMKKSCNN